MEQVNISWHILESDNYVEYTDYDAGTFSTSDVIALKVQVWNNRYGQDEITTIDDARISFSFEKAEDSLLLNYMFINVEEEGERRPELIINRATINIGKLSGEINDGIANQKNSDNYKSFEIIIKGFPENLRSGFKNIMLNIEEN